MDKTISRNSLKMKKKNTKSRQDEDENIQSKNEFKASKSKTTRLKIDKWWRSNEERQWMVKNIHEIDHENVTEALRKRYGSASALIFSFFLLLLTNFKWNLSQNLMDRATIGIKKLNVTSKNPHVDKELSLDKIRVW